MASVQFGVARLEPSLRLAASVARLQPPAAVERREAHGVAGFHLEDRRKIAREVTVQCPSFRLDRVKGHGSTSSIRRRSGGQRTRRTIGMAFEVCDYSAIADAYGRTMLDGDHGSLSLPFLTHLLTH